MSERFCDAVFVSSGRISVSGEVLAGTEIFGGGLVNERDRHRQTEKEIDRHRQTEKETDTDRHRKRQTDTERDRQRQRDRHRQTKRQTQTDRGINNRRNKTH